MKTSDFSYHLPPELIAQHPAQPRDSSRMMVLCRDSTAITHDIFRNIGEYLRPGDCLILNDTKVLPARLYGVKEDAGARVEFLLLRQIAEGVWECLAGPGKKARPGARFAFGGGLMHGEVMKALPNGNRVVKFTHEGNFYNLLERIGEMPLPHYITEKLDDTSRYSAFRVEKGGDGLLVMLYNGGQENGFNGLDYWKYIYSDRRLYLPEDTVKFFGVVSPKQPGTKAINEVTAVIEEDYWNRGSSSAIKTQVSVKNGVYEGEIRLPELAPGYYCLSIYTGEERLGTTYFEVELYRKPAYSLSLSVDQPIIWADEQATVTAATAYFDGTPVAGLDLEMDGKSVKTDGFGKASVRVGTSIDEDDLVSYYGVSVEAELPEIGRVYEHTYIQSVNSNVEIEARAKRDGDKSTLEAQAFQVDFTGMDYLSWYGDNKCLKDFGGSLALEVSWTRITYTKVSTGQSEKHYDPYTKTYSESNDYTWEKSEKLEGTKTITVTGKEKQSFPLPLTPGGEYRIDIMGKDTKGRDFTRSTYFYNVEHREYDYDYGKTVYVRDNDGKDAYAIGDKVSLSAYENYDAGVPIEPGSGAVLFMRTSDKFIDCTVSKDNLCEFTFDGSVLPNINVYGVLFDGREYVEHYYPWSVSIDAESRALYLEVTPDKASYRPGETAKLSLKLTGPDGQPVKGTLNLNMVDEALLALREQYADIAEIFWNVYNFDRYSAISHNVVRLTGGGEKGDGEGEGDRSDFRDTALFKTVETDGKGLASAEVKLPDNITSWRLFWQAFRNGEGDIMAGSGRANIIVTLPFFVDIRLGDIFLTGDQPSLGIRSAGTALKDGDVKYTVEIPSLGFKQTADVTPASWYEMPLPALKKGEHSISVTGEYKDYRDKITQKFTVAAGIADHVETETTTLSNGTKFDIPAKGTAHLVFADKQKAQVIRALWGVLGTSSIRAEQLLAKQAAQDIMAALTPHGRGWYCGTDYAEKIPQYQRENGSIAPFIYGDLDEMDTLATTAWACAVSPESFSKPAAANYLYGQLNSAMSVNGDATKKFIALMGLAALKEPVMQCINDCIDEPAQEKRIYLALAQAFIGNGSAAKAMVRGIIEKYCVTAGQAMYVDNFGLDLTARLTANLAVAAMLLDLPEGGPLYQYVLENPDINDPYLLQQALILRHKAQSVNPECASFKYTLGGETKQVKLFLSHSLMLTTEQLRAIRFSDISDEIEVTASYLAPGFPKGSNMVLSAWARYGSVDMSQSGTATGEIVFSIDEDAPDGYYSIVHILPAGLEFSGLVWKPWQRVWVSEVKGQQVTFTVWGGGDTFRFTARPVMTGSFRSEGTYITNTDYPEFTNSTKGVVVTIK